jgi:hypothetical protein
MAPRTRPQKRAPPRTPPRRPRAAPNAPNAPARARRLNSPRLPGGAARSLSRAFELSAPLEATAHGESQTSGHPEAHDAGHLPCDAAN